MKFFKNPCVWGIAAIFLNLFVYPAYLIVTDKSEKMAVQLRGREEIISVEKDKARFRYNVTLGNCFIYEKDGQVVRQTIIVTVRRPTITMITVAPAEETALYRQIFTAQS